MSPIVVLGASDFGRETFFHVRDALGEEQAAKIVFFDEKSQFDFLDFENKYRCLILKDIVQLNTFRQNNTHSRFSVGVGVPQTKQLLVEKALSVGLVPAPTLVHPRALVQDSSCHLGLGGVICPGVAITTNVFLGNYVVLNFNTTVGHDCIIEEYVTCNPGVQVSGKVVLRRKVFAGVRCVIREGITVPGE